MNQENTSSKEEKFEALLEKLQGIVRELESGECSLEDSIGKFESGVALAKSCQERLNQAEQKIEVLVRASGNGVTTKPFEEE